MAIESVSGKFIRADSCCNENAHLYQSSEGITQWPKSAMALKLDQRFSMMMLQSRLRERGKRISRHKQRRWHTCGMLTSLNAAIWYTTDFQLSHDNIISQLWYCKQKNLDTLAYFMFTLCRLIAFNIRMRKFIFIYSRANSSKVILLYNWSLRGKLKGSITQLPR